ncbi:MAG: pyridoxal phosphate-dependent aminotransferase [Clostridia bacterium]|nr:pyridoxal phosphate-dependent aminotransferase [Clostridia bacterium]
MINEKNVQLGKVRSAIRELFEYGKKRKAEIGEDNVYDFSIGNPSVPAPKCVNDALVEIIQTYDPVFLHGYTSAQGDYSVRKVLADYINERFSTSLNADCLYLTCGAAASLTICLNALVNDGDEVITFSPYFPEYRVFAENAGAKFIVVAGEAGTFKINFAAFEKVLSKRTKAVIINSPNNPSGVVYGEDEIIKLSEILKKYSEKFGNPIYLIADEPYRELVFDKEVKVPFAMNYYTHTLVCYSYSKSLSLPGERIGYIAVNNQMTEFEDVYAGVCGAGRALGFICAPNLFQQLIKKAYNVTSDIAVYKNNRDLLYGALTEYGYEVVKPDGAFYMFVKALEKDANAFCERAKKYELLLVPGDSFGCEGYVRVSYCVSPDMIKKSLSSFKALIESYNA